MIKSSTLAYLPQSGMRYLIPAFELYGGLGIPLRYKGYEYRIGIPTHEMVQFTPTDKSVGYGRNTRTVGESLIQGELIPNTNTREVFNEQWIYELKPTLPPDVLTKEQYIKLFEDNLAQEGDTSQIPYDMSDCTIQVDHAERMISILFHEPDIFIRTQAPWWGTSQYGFIESQDAARIWTHWESAINDYVLYGSVASVMYSTRYPGGTAWHTGCTLYKQMRYKYYSYVKTSLTVSSQRYANRQQPSFGNPLDFCWKLACEGYDKYHGKDPLSLSSYHRYFAKNNCSFVPKANLLGVIKRIPTTAEMERIQREFSQLESVYHPDFSRAEREDAKVKVVENFNYFNSNMFLYATDLGRFGDSVRAIRSLITDLKNPKAWAKAWLAGRYSDRLTISDTRELIAGIESDIAAAKRTGYDRWRHKIRQGGEGKIKGPVKEYEYSYSDYENYELVTSSGLLGDCENILASLYRWDLAPTLENIWDAIPFSFVADWCLGVSDLFARIDASAEAEFIDAKAQIVGRRREFTMDLSLFSPDLSGTLTHVVYSRKAEKFLSDINPVGLTLSVPRPINFVDGAALGTQAILSLS